MDVHKDSIAVAVLPLHGSGGGARHAGRKRLEANPAISGAIRAAGMSVTDYFIAAIAWTPSA